MKRIFMILATISAVGCSNSDDSEQQFNMDIGLELSVRNSENEDLLDPNNSNQFNTETIKLFYVVNGETEEVYNENLDSPRNFNIYQHQNEYRIRITPNSAKTAETPITYIQWNQMDTDTLEVEYSRNENSVLQNKIWLNGKQIWERGDNTVDPYYVLVK